jgi:hypothetical protein
MKTAIISALLAIAVPQGSELFAAMPKLEKVSEHCYYVRSEAGRPNIAAVATEEGILMVDPPSDVESVVAVMESLRKASPKGVRWVVFTDPRYVLTAGARHLARQGAVFLASSQLHKLSVSLVAADIGEPAAPAAAADGSTSGKLQDFAWFVFGSQMRLFPAGLEIRVLGLRQKARTAGDVALFVPAEKVLLVGRLFKPASYPEIDTASGGNAAGWIDGMRQIVDSVPVLKSAIPQAKPSPTTEPEKTLEEGIAVIPAFGEVSNLQVLKDLLDASQKLRNDVSRALRAGRTCSSFLASSRASQHRSQANLDDYACRLFDDLSAGTDWKKAAGSK